MTMDRSTDLDKYDKVHDGTLIIYKSRITYDESVDPSIDPDLTLWDQISPFISKKD